MNKKNAFTSWGMPLHISDHNVSLEESMKNNKNHRTKLQFNYFTHLNLKACIWFDLQI